jgi:phage shock protein A
MANRVLADLAVRISANTAEFQKQLSQANRSLSGTEKALKGVSNTLNALGIGFGAFQIAGIVKAAVGSVAALESELSTVKAVTRATDEEFEKLRKSAIALGSSTKFTATQVAGLQAAYGRLGFTTSEILAASEATLLLATATREDLAKSADIAGSTLRAFGLEAEETGRVVDVMGLSFSRSALQLDSFAEAMKFVAPVARAAGVTIEETTALLGVLADNGIRGSNAGTALRRILVDLTKDGRPARDRILELANAGLTLESSFDEVGRIAQTSLLVLGNNIDKIDEGTIAYNNASGAIKDMSDVIRDNLTEDVTRLTSAYDGLIQKLGDTSFLRSVVRGTTDFINTLSGTNEGLNALDNLLVKLNSSQVKVNEEFKKSDSNVKVLQRLKDEGNQLVISYSDLVKLNKEFADPTLFSQIIQNFSDVIKVIDSPQDRLNQNTKALRKQLGELKEEYQKTFDPQRVEELTNQIIILEEKLNEVTFVGPKIGDLGKRWDDFGKKISEVPERIPLLAILGEQLDELRKKQKAAFTADDVRRYGREIDALQKKISDLTRGISNIPPLPLNIDPLEKLSLEAEIRVLAPTGLLPFQEELAVYLEGIKEFSDDSSAAVAASQQKTRDELQRTITTAMMLGDTFGDAFGSVISGQATFVQGLARLTDGVVQQYGRQAIAAAIAKAVQSSPTAFGVVLAASAATAAISALLRKAAGFRGGSGGGGSFSRSGLSSPTSFAFAQDSSGLRLQVDPIVIRGQDLYVSLTNYEKNSRNTRNG